MNNRIKKKLNKRCNCKTYREGNYKSLIKRIHDKYNTTPNDIILLTTSKNSKHILSIKLFRNTYPVSVDMTFKETTN